MLIAKAKISIMAKNKTIETNASVKDFVSTVKNEVRRRDSLRLIELMKSITGFAPKMWGPTMIGFGTFHYKYASGHEGDAPLAAFSPRKDSLVIYVAPEFEEREILLSKLGKHKSSKSCVYAKKLDDLDVLVLEKIIRNSIAHATSLYHTERQQYDKKVPGNC
jgi:hypothetical protein